jgi:DNA polymerase III sliding clamp (beta) subunit (PCNA family)
VSFTVEAKRIQMLLDSVGTNQVMELSVSDAEVVIRTSHGKIPFSSLDSSLFPFWDDVLVGAKVTAKIPADRLHAAFTHTKQFIYDQEAKAPQLCVAEFRDGVLHSTDQMAVSLVKVPGMEQVSFRVYVKDLPNVLSFLATAKGEDVEILESDRASFIRKVDGAVFGESVFKHVFPTINPNWDMTEDQVWELDKDLLVTRIKTLQAGARSDEPRVRFQRNDKEIVLAMTSQSGKPMSSQPIPLSDLVVTNDEGFPVFAITDVYIEKMLNGNGNAKIKLGISKKKAGGWVRIKDTRGVDTYLTTVAWLKNT